MVYEDIGLKGPLLHGAGLGELLEEIGRGGADYGVPCSPAWIPVFSVDISPSILTKLADRGSFQTTGLVTDVEPFFRTLLSALEELESGSREAPGGGLPSRADRHMR